MGLPGRRLCRHVGVGSPISIWPSGLDNGGGAVSHQSRADHVLRMVPPHPPKSRCMFGGGQDGLGPKSLEPKAVLGLEVWCPRLGQE